MSDADRPFAPTPNRLARARREGRLPRSHDLAALAAFAAGLAGAALALPAALAAAAGALDTAARTLRARAVLPAAAALAGWALVPLACAASGALAAALVEGGGLRFAGLSLDAKRLDPAAGLRRIFSRAGLANAARATLSFACALAAVVPAGRAVFARAPVTRGPGGLLALASGATLRALCAVLAVAALFAAADAWSARRTWLHGLRMTHEELRRDQRETEGDPHARGRRSALHRSLVRGALARVREASFVVANPEHVAVALKYAPPDVPVPEILVRAADDGAQRVKALARAHGIPIVEDVVLARALFAAGAGVPIPRELYVTVACVVAALLDEGLL